VVRINDAIVGDGRPGPITTKLRAAYIDWARATAI
jgi:branched-subunit amino acid aminotransferase/4-amino-4-deoxychorismate lyase